MTATAEDYELITLAKRLRLWEHIAPVDRLRAANAIERLLTDRNALRDQILLEGTHFHILIESVERANLAQEKLQAIRDARIVEQLPSQGRAIWFYDIETVDSLLS